MTSDTIRNKIFQTVKKGGYDPGEVQDFLLEVAAEYAQLEEANAALQRQLEQKAAQPPPPVPAKPDTTGERVLEVLDQLRKTSVELIEQSKTNAAAIAMRTEQDRRILFEQARKEAEIIIRDAEKKADVMLDAAHTKAQEYRDEIGILQARRLAIISRVKSLLASQEQFLESLEKDALGQTQELTEFVNTARNKPGIGSGQIQSIIDQMEDQADKKE